ncbi:hypothetical protein [Dickeya dianthicola]|uniref:hypothetical protein n=1 Tax=Dickeya dianthicola TaxID=204039 RepID=UPI00137129BA|nr:hypothetical protein [Dickeya dianthicola]MCI4239347.1 hypothetical protein [Dickeya dianthicola]MCI4256259.1 hypothetical protein [Dickeya dianthicola]
MLTRQNRHYTAPACGFRIAKIFQFYFSTKPNASPRRRRAFAGGRPLKTVKGISSFFSFLDPGLIAMKLQLSEIKGFYVVFVVWDGSLNAHKVLPRVGRFTAMMRVLE